MTGGLELLLLGDLEVRRDGDAVGLAGSKLPAVVALLALGVPHAVSGDRLIDELWGERLPSNPVNALQAQISQIRKLLGSDAVARQGSGYRLLVEPDAVDATRLERLVRQGRAEAAGGDPSAALESLQAAVSGIRGPALAGLSDFAFARRAARRLDELAVSAHEELIEVSLVLGRHGDVIASLNALVDAHPMRERLHAQLVVALYRCGRQADALRAYQSARSTLIEELGIEPGPVLRDLERAVLAHDPTLDAPVVSAARRVEPTAAQPDPDVGGRSRAATGTGLVGRAAELEALRADLGDVVAGGGRVALIGGEPGIGKTRLIEELASEAARLDVVVEWGRCYSGRGAPVLWPWTRVLSGLIEEFDGDDLRDALKYGAAGLAAVVPAIGELVGGGEQVPPTDPETARFRLVEAASTVLRRLSRVRPILVVIDDLQWADRTSLELLGFAGSDLADLRLMIAATYRTVDPPVEEQVAELLDDLARHRWVRRIDLAGLDSPALSNLLATAGPRPSAEAVTELQNRTRGNPFFVIETLRLIESSNKRVDTETVRRVVPASVRGVIRRRVARLPPDTVAALSAASVLGHDLELTTAASVAGVDAREMLARIEPAVQAGLLIDSPDGVERFRFSHGLVQETLYHDMGPAQCAELHRRAGEALEQRHGTAPGVHLLALANHWYHAVPAAAPGKGIDYARQAAMWSLGTIDHRQAEVQLRIALELVATLPAGQERNLLELDILDQQALLAASALTTYTSAELAASMARTRDLCAALGEPARLVPALWRISTFHLMRAEIGAGATIGHELLALAARSGDTGALFAGHLCLGVMLTHQGHLAGARRHLDQAIEMGDAGHTEALRGLLEDPSVFARAFSAITHWLLGDDMAAERDLDAGLAAAGSRHEASPYSTSLARWAVSMVAVLRRDVHSAAVRCAEGAANALANGFPVGAHIHAALGGWAIAAGTDLDRGLSEIVDHTDALMSVRPGYLRPWLLALHADACLIGERFEEVLRSADAGLAVAEVTGEVWCRAELLRLRAEARAGIDPADRRIAADLREARRVASNQGSRAWLQRIDHSLAVHGPAT